MKNYYFDESGFTGNFKILDKKFNSNENEIFILSSIGCNSTSNLKDEVYKLKKTFRIKSEELKSKQILKRYNRFLPNLLEVISKSDVNVLIEVIDKKYFLCTQLTENLVFSRLTSFISFEVDNLNARKIYASLFYDILPIELLEEYSYLIHNPSYELFDKFIKNLIVFLDKKHWENMSNSFITKDYHSLYNQHVASLKGLVEDIYLYYVENFKKSSAESKKLFEYFLPIGDYSYNNNFYNTYYHLNCFTNIIIRNENLCEEKEIKLIHDNQLESQIILEKNLEWMKKNMALHNNYSLKFEDSKNDIMIQVTDILSGGLRKSLEKISKNINLEEEARMLKLINSICEVNYVLPIKVLDYLSSLISK